jgi:hypothetical protein
MKEEQMAILLGAVVGFFLMRKLVKILLRDGMNHLLEMQESHPEEWGI